jgi:hypothetical protein
MSTLNPDAFQTNPEPEPADDDEVADDETAEQEKAATDHSEQSP